MDEIFTRFHFYAGIKYVYLIPMHLHLIIISKEYTGYD